MYDQKKIAECQHRMTNLDHPLVFLPLPEKVFSNARVVFLVIILVGIGDIESAMKNKVSPSSSISPRSSMGQIYPHTSVKTTPVSTQSSVDDNAKSNTPHSRENTANTQLFRPTGPTTPLEIFSNNNLILSAFPQFSTAMGNHLASYSPHVSKIGGTPQNPAVTPGRSGHGSGLLSIGTVGTTPAIPFNPSNFLHTGADARLLCSLAPDADLHLNFQNLHKIYELQQHPESSAAASSTSSGMHLSTTGRASATLGVGGAGRSSLSPNLRPSSVSTSTQRIQG